MRSISSKLVAAAAGILLMTSPALAQQQRSDNGTDANGPITIIKNMVAETSPVRVTINGHEIDHLKEVTYADITTNVHRGVNKLHVMWAPGTTMLNFKIDFAATRNNFKDVIVVNKHVSSAGGSWDSTFTIPG
jgi:hypothetical protein